MAGSDMIHDLLLHNLFKSLGQIGKTMTGLQFLANLLSYFLKTGVISANLRFFGKLASPQDFINSYLLKRRTADIRRFLSTLTGMLFDATAFSVLIFKISFSTYINQLLKAHFKIKLSSNSSNTWMAFIFLVSKFYWVGISDSIWNVFACLLQRN